MIGSHTRTQLLSLVSTIFNACTVNILEVPLKICCFTLQIQAFLLIGFKLEKCDRNFPSRIINCISCCPGAGFVSVQLMVIYSFYTSYKNICLILSFHKMNPYFPWSQHHAWTTGPILLILLLFVIGKWIMKEKKNVTRQDKNLLDQLLY